MDVSDHVRWLEQPVDLSVFQLRQRDYRLATAHIVAVTEDHCRVTAGWCRRILALHAAHPEAIAIGGAVDNGTRDTNIDWAAYPLTQGPYTAPLDDGPTARVTGPANLSLKRQAVAPERAHRLRTGGRAFAAAHTRRAEAAGLVARWRDGYPE